VVDGTPVGARVGTVDGIGVGLVLGTAVGVCEIVGVKEGAKVGV